MTGTYSRLRQLDEHSPTRLEERPSVDDGQLEVPETQQKATVQIPNATTNGNPFGKANDCVANKA